MSGEVVRVFAPAKVNLSLAVTGRRGDGYHLLDTVVVFADVGDDIAAEPAETLSVAVDGPFAGELQDAGDNLALRAAEALREAVRMEAGARLRLTKRLPVASGIGGGSADAAATLKALDRLWGLRLPADRLHRIAAGLGADVPMCVRAAALRATGAGDILSPIEGFPALPLVLANPMRPVSTAAVFGELSVQDADVATAPPDGAGLGEWLASARNDLEEPARRIEPAIGEVLDGLAALDGARFARMSGSGATCFALFADIAAARAAAFELAAERPGWWIAPTLAR